MTLTDYMSKNKGPPKWIEEDQTVSVQVCVGEDVIVELKLFPSDHYDDLRFELIRDGLPIPSDRYRLSMRGNIVQLALKQSHKNDAGYYSLVATRLGQGNDKGALKKIHLSIDEPSYEEGDPPIFLRRLSDLAIKVGTRTRFLVEIRSATSPKVTWYKNDVPIHEGSRFSLVHEGNFYCVDVVPVIVEDQGCWTCMAENRSGRSSCTSSLTVVVPKAYKKPEFIEELRALLTETGTVSLECKVVGVPTPVLRWFKDNKEIKAGDVFALTANPDDPTSLGVYTCEAVNCMGTAFSSSKVHVVGRGSREGSLKPADTLTPSGPLPVFKHVLQDECCRIGDTLVLSCRVQVPPWPKTIVWYNKEGRVEPSEKYHVMEDGIGGYSIEIKQVEAVDEGEWKCVATSEENMKQFTNCYVAMSIPRNYRKPRFMENLKAVLTEEGLVSFECKVVGFPTPLLRWFKDGQELKPGDVYQLTGTNSLGSYCCIARNCMGEAKSTAELTIEDIQNQLNEEERFQLLSVNQPPKFIKSLRSCEARINEDFRFTVQVSIAPEPSLTWYRDDALVDESDKYYLAKENLGTCHLEVQKLEFIDQAEWKCVAANDFGHSVTSCFLKLIIPKHYKKPKFLESLRAILSEEGAVNLECKVIGVPQPILKWYKDNVELKPGDIHRIISGQDGSCCLGTYTCEATNCMGTVSSSASLLGFEDKKNLKKIQSPNGHELARNLSLSTIHEERTSQLYDTPQTDHSVTLDERGEVSFSFDGKEVSVSLYETPDLTEEEALQIVEMYADQLSEHVTEHNVIELPPMRFVKETSTSGNLLMEAVVIDVSPDYFVSAEDGDDLRTEADFDDVSIMDDQTHVLSSPERDSRGSLKRSARHNGNEDDKVPSRPPRKKSMSVSSSKSEKSQRIESESFHSAQKDEQPLSPLSSLKQDDSDTFADALSSAHLSITESLIQKNLEHSTIDSRKRSLSAEKTSLDDGIGGDSSLDSITGVPKKKKQRQDKSSEEYSNPNDYEGKRESENKPDTKMERGQLIEIVDKTYTNGERNEAEENTKTYAEEKLLDNLKNTKGEMAPVISNSSVNTSPLEEIRNPIEDILLEPRIALREALQMYESMPNTLTSRLFRCRQSVNDIYRKLEVSQGKDADIEVLINLATPLHTLLKAIDKVTLAEDVKIIRNTLKTCIIQLSNIVKNLKLSSLQSTLAILKKIDESICNISNGTGELSSIKSISAESRNVSEEIIDPLIDIQSAFSTILDYMEQSKAAANGTIGLQESLITSRFAACLIELRECISHTAHIAMTFKENETLNSLMEFTEPLLDLQSILVSEQYTPQECFIIKETNLAIRKLKTVVITILKNSENSEVISRVGMIVKLLEDTDEQMLKFAEQLLEAEDTQKYILKNLNVDQSLSSVHFALSSVLEKQEKHIASCHLTACIEELRQTIGSSAVRIANLKNPIDDEITQEISKLKESLLILQKNLLTEKHESEEEEVLNNLLSPINKLKDIVHNVIENTSSVESIIPMLELLEEIEKDALLVAKEISKKNIRQGSATKFPKENTEKISDLKSILAGRINRSLDPIKHWLSSISEDSTKNEMGSALSSTIEELKRDISKIAIQTSYSESPSDESLIEALIDLREPLMKLRKAISVYHPEDLSILEGISYPMKHLLQTIMDVLQEHTEKESLRSIINIVEQIENQIPLSIKNAFHQQKLGQSEIFTVEAEEEVVTGSRETIPGTLTEIASAPFEAWPIALPTEQVVTEDSCKKTADNTTPQSTKDKKKERKKNASKLIMILSETLEKLQLEITSILEDFEESTTRTITIPQSKLAYFLEELRRTISTIRVMTIVYHKEIGSIEEKVNQTTLVLPNLLQPLTNIQNLLSRKHEHDILELMILNRLTPLLNMIENDVIKQTIDFVGKDGDMEKEFESLLCVLEEIKVEIPVVIQEISSKRKILECLRDISKPLESIIECMNDLEETEKETLEMDVTKILGKPIVDLLKNIKTVAQEVDILDKELVIFELRNLIEPLLEFHTCLSMVQSSRRNLVPETSLLDEKKNVILRAIDDLQKQVCYTVEAIANMKEISLLDESLMLLNSAILQAQKQIGKTDYSRRSSNTKILLQHRLSGTLNHLANTIIDLEKLADEDTYGIVSKCLEALKKQISLAQTQFIQTDSQSIDEEAIIEGFLYPTNQLLSALNVLKENAQQKVISVISHNLMDQFRKLANAISELSSSLSTYRTELIQEGVSKIAPIVETFSAVIDVLDHVKDTIITIDKIVVEEKPITVITKLESITDEIIEVSREIDSVMTVTEVSSSKAIIQEDAELNMVVASTMAQTSNLENLEILTHIEQTEDNLTDVKKYEENQQENEIKIQVSKFNSTISNLEQPLKELINFVASAMQKSLISKSEEEKRKIRELTVLIQILYDLQATSTSIKTVLSSLRIIPLNDQIHLMQNIFIDLEQATDMIIFLTHEGVKSELKENVVTSLQSLIEPLSALENVLLSICQTINEDKYVDKDGIPLIAIVKVLISCINDSIKSLNSIKILKCVRITDDKETKLLRTKEETKDIEETTARPLEELIEAIMYSQEHVKCDKTSPFESNSLLTDSIKSKDIDNLNSMEKEMELNKSFVEKTDNLKTEIMTSVVEIPPSSMYSQLSSQIEELSTKEKIVMSRSLAKSFEEVEKQSIATIGQQKIELNQTSENDTMQSEQIEVKTLQAIISPLEILRKSFDEIKEMEIFKSLDKRTIAFSTLVEPLLKLEFALNRETQQIYRLFVDTEEIKQNTMTLEKLSIASVFEELQESITTIQEQLNAVAEANSGETFQLRLIQTIEKSLEDLKISIACIQNDSMIYQQKTELSRAEQISILQSLTKSLEKFGERFIPIVNQLKIEAKFIPPSYIVKQEDQKLDSEILYKIVDPIHFLHEIFSQINDFKCHKIEILEIADQKTEVVQLNAVIQQLEKLEQLLIASIQEITIAQEEMVKKLSENPILLTNANVKPILEELRNSIIITQQQAAFKEDTFVVKTLNKALEDLKISLTNVEEVVDHFNEVTETEKISALLTFAKSVEKTANQLVVIVSEQTAQQEIRETPLLKTITIPMEGLQSAILKLEDRVSQVLETKQSIKAVALECMIQPLQQLQQSFLIASHQETALSLQRLPIKPILDNLSKFVVIIQDQVTTIQEKLFVEESTSDLAVLKDFARSLGDLRTSTVVLQQLNAIENASQQIIEIENASALQAFAKSIEEFRKCCSIVVERPKIVEAFTTNMELEQSTKIDTHLLENVIAPLRILQEQILTIEEIKMQQPESLDITEMRKPATVLNSLIDPLQQLEKSFVATVQKEHVIEANETYSESFSANLEKLALQPILEEIQKSIATVQEHVILETGNQVASEMETVALLKSITQSLVDLRASIASIQQITAIAPDPLDELAQQQNVSALETFAETLHNLAERIVMCNHQQIIMEPAADTISEDVSPLNTWADIIEEPISKVTRPMIIDQGTVDSPVEIAVSISEDEASVLKTLAKPLTELRECLALIVEERKIITSNDTTCSLLENENISLLKTMIQPLLELKYAAALVIEEKMVVERANERSFAIESNNESTLGPLIEPLEELWRSIAIIQDQMLIETSTDRPKDDIILHTLAEPLFDLQRAISILETRVMSPDIEPINDTSNNWITECLATPLHEIEKSIADIRHCIVMEPENITVKEQTRISPDWSIVEELVKQLEGIKSVISHVEDDFADVFKIMIEPLASVQKNLTILRNKSNLNTTDERDNTKAIVESLINLEKCITCVEEKIIGKPPFKRSSIIETDTTTFAALSLSLTELKRSIVTIEESPSAYLKNLKTPLELVQGAFETVLSMQQNKKLSNLCTKIQNTIIDINASIESIKCSLEEQVPAVIEVYVEYEALGMLMKPLQNIKQCIAEIQEKPEIVDLIINAFQKLDRSIAIIREQSADKPSAESQQTSAMIGISKNLTPYLNELQELIKATNTLWSDKNVLEGLRIIEEPICKLQAMINIIHHHFLVEEPIWTIKEQEITYHKKPVKKEVKDFNIENKDDEKRLEKEEKKEEDQKDEKIVRKELKQKNTESDNIGKESKTEEQYEKIEGYQENKENTDKLKKGKEEQKEKKATEETQKLKEEETKSKEIGNIREIEQSKISIKDEKIKEDKSRHKKIEETESPKKEIRDSKETVKIEKIRKIKDEQKDAKNQEETSNVENKRQEKEKTVQEWKEPNEYKTIEENLRIKNEEIRSKNIQENENIKKEETHLKKKNEVEKIEIIAEKLKDTKKIDKIKEIKQYKENENEIIKKDEEKHKQEEEINKLKQKEQKHIKNEEDDVMKEKDMLSNETKTEKINKQEEYMNLEENKKLENEQEDFKNKDIVAQLKQAENIRKEEKSNQLKKEEEQKRLEKIKEEEKEQKEEEAMEEEKKIENDKTIDKKNKELKKKEEKCIKKEETLKTAEILKKEEIINKIKAKENKNANEKKIEKTEEKEEELTKNETKSVKMREKKQKSKNDTETPRKGDIIQIEEEKDRMIKNEKTVELEKKKEEFDNKGEAAKVKIEKEKMERKEKNKDEKSKEKKQSTETVEIKIVKDAQMEIKQDMQDDKKMIIQKKKKEENKKNENEKQIGKKKDEIVKMKKEIQSEYIKKEKDERQQQQYKEVNKNQEQEEIEHMEQKQKERLNEKIQELQPKIDKNLHLEMDVKEIKELKEQKQQKLQNSKTLPCAKDANPVNKSDEYKQTEQNHHQKGNDDNMLHMIQTEYLKNKEVVEQFKKQEADHESKADKERFQKRNDEKRIKRDETARLLREEERKLRRRQEEEILRNKQRREKQIRESEWSKKRENESDRFLRNMLETKCEFDKSALIFSEIDYPRSKRKCAFRFDSSIPIMLSSTSRSYSWRDSLTSLTRKRIDDYWKYKLRDPFIDKSYFDSESAYRRRRRRENRMIRARSISLLKYEDYLIRDSNVILRPTTYIRPIRRTKTETIPHISFDNYEFSPFSYVGLNQSENLPIWDKPKKPSFCTRLTNRVVGVGMRTRLTCTVLGNPEPHVYWTKDGQELDISSNHYRMRFENGMAYLELHDALPEDAGVYICVAENTHGTSSSESTLKVYSDYKLTYSSPTFVKSIKDIYRYSDHKLILECRIRAHPAPTVSWLKDGEILQGVRYKQTYLDDDIYRLEIIDPDFSDNGQYTCRAVNELRTEEISHMVYVEDREWRSVNQSERNFGNKTTLEVARRPQFSNLLKDYSVPAGGTIALQVEVKGIPAPEVKWLRGDLKEPIAIPKAKTFVERGLHTLIVPEATESERGTYICTASNAYGQVDTSATVDVISPSAIDGGKPAVFVSRPVKKSIDVTVSEDVSISFRVNGIPKPRVTWMKGLTDITDGPRSYKESIDDYVRLTLKKAIPSDEGTYCILVKNRYGCDRYFFSIKVKQRARSLTPLPDWNSIIERDIGEGHDDDMSYVRNVPGPISSEPVVVDGGKNWLSLSWGKAERRGPAPVIAYKVDAWLLGSDGGARWTELGVTPINAFDAFNLRPGGEYKFRVTPRNRYGWGEPVIMVNSVLVSESNDLPEFTKILPGQLKALADTSIKLECEIRGNPKMEIRWYRETIELDPRNDSRFAIHYNGSKCSLTITNVKEDDSGRYVCEANNRIGKVSSFARVLVITDPRIIEADKKLRTRSLSTESGDRPPQFTMRIRDRRVQATYPVRLTCQIVGYPVPEITWHKDGIEITQDDRHIFWDDDSNFHTLEIIQSTLDDSGCYMVTARNINGSVSGRCILVVDKGIRAYIAPEFLRDLDMAYMIQLGGELRMSAQLEAYPSVGVVWHRDGIRLRPSRRAVMMLSHDGTVQFSLANVTARDAGVYSCTATNVVGHAETSTRVTIIAPSIQNQSSIDGLSSVMTTSWDIPYSKEPLFVTKPLSSEAVEGDTVTILCEVVGDPKPEVIWLRDFLKPDYYKDAPHFRLVGAGPQYRLEIPYAKLNFTGTYSVIARNCHGETKAVISLQIYAKGQGKEDQTQTSPHRKVLTLPIIKRELRDLRCCDGDAISLECKVYATPEPPLVRWERGGKIISMVGDFDAEFDGETARLSIQHVYPEDEGEYTCVAYNDLGKAYTSACLVVDVPEGKENILNQRLTRPTGLLSAGSTPRSTPRSTPIRSLSPAVSHGREFRSPQVLPRRSTSKRPKICPPKFYAVPHNRLVQEGETVRFQCAVIGHPAPWVRWDKNGTIVSPSVRISIKERDDVKMLEIIDVMREDAALYRVTAENDFGRIEASARLEVISRYESTNRTIRTRSASPKTYPSFDRSLLPTTSRINGRLQLECRIRGTPRVTPTWYRNGRPLERSSRIKKYFDGATAKIEITKVKASDAGEYTCVATNVLGSTRNSCQVTLLHPHDPSVADKSAPQFLLSLPEESIIMENHSYEFQTGISGTPPFTITWSKDDCVLPDSDRFKYVVYGDGGVALRLSDVHSQDAGEYICVVQNDFGVTSCTSLFAVQGYKDVPKLALQFTKTPLSVVTTKGSTVYFCARVQCGKTTEIVWWINGKNARENAKCKIERDDNVSILRICNVLSCNTGEIRCTATMNGKGPSITAIAKLQLQRPLYDLGDSVTRFENIQSHMQVKLLSMNADLLDAYATDAELLSLEHRRRCRESSSHTRSFSFPWRTASSAKYISSLPVKKRIPNALTDVQKLYKSNISNIQRVMKKNLDSGVLIRNLSNDRRLSSLNENDKVSILARLSPMEQLHQRDVDAMKDRTNNQIINLESLKESNRFNDKSIVCVEHPSNDEQKAAHSPKNPNEKGSVEPRLEELMKATIVKEPTDVIVFRGNKALLKVTYQGHLEPTVKWFRMNRELRATEEIGISSEPGVSYLTLNNVTYDHAGKYEILVENLLGKERRFFSLAVEGPPEPPTGQPSVNFSAGQATIIWQSLLYDGGRTVIGYAVEAKRAGESTWMVIAESCHSLSQTVPIAGTNFVVPSESCRFRVREKNIHGLSDPGAETDFIRIPKREKVMFREEKEEKLEPSKFEPRIVEPEEGRLFSERYDVLEELGKGRYGIVKKVIERATDMCFAAKFVRTIKVKDREQVREEIRIMNVLRHPKLLLLAAAYESPRETVLVMEYISGGELFERVVADDFTLTERDSILFIRQICEGVEYMHKNKIVHLDLKPENIMCRTRTSHQIKLIDFGLAQTLIPDTPIRVLFGTPEFIPPEIISYEPIGTESDMWSIGVICYVLLTGLSPFMGDNDAETFANITRADYDLDDEVFDAISNNAKDFISSLLIKRKELRMSATQCLEHPWMAQHATAMSRVALPTEKLKKFIIRRKWQKTGNAIRALGRMAILSAYNRRSPTTTTESSILEQSFDIETRYSNDGNESDHLIVDKNTVFNETKAEENPVEAESRRTLFFPDMTEENMKTAINDIKFEAIPKTCQKKLEMIAVNPDDLIQTVEIRNEIKNIDSIINKKSSTNEESSLDSLSKQINTKNKTLELDIKLIPKIKNIQRNNAAHLEILMSEKNKGSEKQLTEKSSETGQHMILRSQTFCKMFRGDSRDSGIGDCSSNQVTSQLQIDELGVSPIEEEVDYETYGREGKQALKKEETLKNRRSSTASILINLTRVKENTFHDTENIKGDSKVATKSSVTKASCEINPERKADNQNTDTRLLIGHNRDKYPSTGNVSRTARIFERESGTSKSNDPQISAAQRTYPAAIIAGKPYNERIQKVFAFWNK